MQINILHRPETGRGREKIFQMEQEMVHKLGFKTTILATVPALEDNHTIDLMKMYHDKFGDELGISFHILDTPSIAKLVGFKEVAFWLYDEPSKRKVIRFLVDRFKELFGFEPKSAASYHFDASSLKVLSKECPSIKTVVGGCFEEGVRVYHGCNNSWYLFNEGMPWAAWYPSRSHALRPAKDKKDAFDIVAVPHLSRDLVLAYEGRNDFWASHPPNVQRGKGNLGENCPYDKNLIDQHRYQERFNEGYSYLNVFVSAQWLVWNHNSEEPPEVSISLYRQQLEYIKSLVDKGEAEVQTMDEFGRWYRKKFPVNHREVALAKEILYGSGKHYLWYIDPYMRVLVDFFQGCSIGDLRPFISQVPVTTGPDGSHGMFASYPYLIHSQHRSGYLNHCFDGSRTTAILKHDGAEVDLADVECKCDEVFENQRGFVSKPARVRFGEKVTATLKTRFLFEKSGEVIIERELLSIEGSDNQQIEITEYFKGCYGVTEYPQDMSSVKLSIDGNPRKNLKYKYKRQSLSSEKVKFVQATIPPINTIVGFKSADGKHWKGTITEGLLFSPYYTFTLTRTMKPGETSRICLYLKAIK